MAWFCRLPQNYIYSVFKVDFSFFIFLCIIDQIFKIFKSCKMVIKFSVQFIIELLLVIFQQNNGIIWKSSKFVVLESNRIICWFLKLRKFFEVMQNVCSCILDWALNFDLLEAPVTRKMYFFRKKFIIDFWKFFPRA